MFEPPELPEESSPRNGDEVHPQAPAAAYDPYGGVALGVECAWPSETALHSR